jgi:uncharacterized protein YndB with AHSA1/START domain
MYEEEQLSVKVKRFIKAPRERVYAAWADPAQLTKWFGPGTVVTRKLTADVRVGGRFQWECTDPEGKEVTISGQYHEVVPGRKIVFTWRLEEDDDWKDHNSMVTVEFFDQADGTEVRLTHENLPTKPSRDDHEQGWNSVLDKLEEFIG